MTKYVKASDSLIDIIGKEGKELTVTERAFNVVYAGKGFKRVNEVQKTDELGEFTVKELKSMLDEQEIEYSASAKKEELIQLLGE